MKRLPLYAFLMVGILLAASAASAADGAITQASSEPRSVVAVQAEVGASPVPDAESETTGTGRPWWRLVILLPLAAIVGAAAAYLRQFLQAQSRTS